MQKVILKTALKTLLGILIALILAFAIASLGFPRSMAKMFEKWGWYNFAIGYYSLSYSYTDSIDDLAHCAEDSIIKENDSKIIKYCEKLIAHKDFEEFCERKNSAFQGLPFNYENFISDSLAKAKERKGIKEDDAAFVVVFEDLL